MFTYHPTKSKTMTIKIVIVLSILSIISAFLIQKIARKNPNKSSPWKKYITYNLLLILNIGLMLLGMKYYFLFGILLVGIGFKELISTAIQGQLPLSKIIFSLAVFSIIAFLFLTFLNSKSTDEILFYYFSVILFDAFSQISGQLFGKHKITKISPNKTYEGVIGGFLVTVVAQLFVLDFNFNSSLWLNGCLVCLFAFAGDLLASLYKRKVGTKDFSSLLPGQGGVLDRYDSWIFASVILVWL